jgi:hypothetical protein
MDRAEYLKRSAWRLYKQDIKHPLSSAHSFGTIPPLSGTPLATGTRLSILLERADFGN